MQAGEEAARIRDKRAPQASVTLPSYHQANDATTRPRVQRRSASEAVLAGAHNVARYQRHQ